ncbi:MAG: polysaccharide biosynthesis/export family protein [bacterium]
MKGNLRHKVTFLFLFTIFVLLSFIDLRNLHAQDIDYRIGAEDVLAISVWENEHLNREVTVRPDGKISFPLLDDIKVEGLTAMEVKEIITKGLTRYMSKPEVTVAIQKIGSLKVYIMGAVSSPGMLSLQRKTNLLQLLAMAGGLTLTENADLEKAYILRNNQRLPVNFSQLVEEGDTTQNVDLLPDDVIYIPDSFARRITVTGEVKSPQTINFKNGITTLDAVLTAGGPTEDAYLNGTMVITKRAGKEETLKVKLNDVMKKGKMKDNLKLEAGDIVIVPARVF